MNNETVAVVEERAFPANVADFDAKKVLGPQEITVLDIMLSGITQYMNTNLDAQLAPIMRDVEERIAALSNVVSATAPLLLSYNGKETEIGVRHTKLELLLKVMSTRQPALIVGPAGTGKTHAAWQVSEAFSVPFFSMSVGAQTSKTDLVGYMSPMGRYMTTAFRDAYEGGGLFLMDEIDAGNPNVLIIVNQALAAKQAPFPDGMVDRHDDFMFVATANTFGLGANRQYVGRNQLDAATLDRFITVEWPVDEQLEGMLVSRYTDGERWHRVVKAVRSHADNAGVRVVVSPRMTIRGAMLLDLGIEIRSVIEMAMPRADHDSWAQMVDVALNAWGA